MSRSALQVHAGGDAPPPGSSTDNGLGEEEEEEDDLDDETDASHLERFMRDRRRARSLPAYPAALLGGVAGGGERKRRVMFADALGLNLASVKHFSALEEPRIPSPVLSRHRSLSPVRGDSDRLVACFSPPEPGEAEARVRRLRVCLERLSVTQFDFRGSIRALCACAGQEVGLRYTFDDWLSHVDAQAVPASDGPLGAGTRFGFTVYTPPFMDPGSAVHFAVYARCSEGEFWDNNDGRNYTLRYRRLPGSASFTNAAFHAT